MHSEAVRLVRELGLKPHLEGGHYAETYRSGISVGAGGRSRDAITSIYYLLTGDSFSAFHRLGSDELWHHYAGSSALIDVIGADRRPHQLTIGDGRSWQVVLPCGHVVRGARRRSKELCAPRLRRGARLRLQRFRSGRRAACVASGDCERRGERRHEFQ